jgi:hypothetical protein
MHLVRAFAVGCVPPEITTTRDAEFTKRFIPQFCEAMRTHVQRLGRRHDAEHVDHRLGDNSRDGCVPDLMQLNRQVRERV